MLSICPTCSVSFSFHLVPHFVVYICMEICLVIHIRGKLSRHSEQVQTYANWEIFYRLYIFSVVSNCHANIVRVLLPVGLKQAVIYVMSNLMARKKIIIHIMKMIIICKAEQKNCLFLRGAN